VNFGGVRTNGRTEGEMPLSLRAQAMWLRLDEHFGHWCDYRMSGHLEVTHDEKVMAEMERWARMALTHGQHSELVTGAQLRSRYPWLNRNLIGGCLVADDGSANPRLVVPTMAVAARRLGADIRENVRVDRFSHDAGRFTLVATNGLTVRAPRLINAAGWLGDGVARHFGESFPVEATAPQVLVCEPTPGMRLGPVLDLSVNGRYLYCRQVENGNIVFGRGDGRIHSGTGRAQVVPESIFTAAHVAIHFIPALRGLNIIRTWSGIDGEMPDAMPVMGLSAAVPGLVHGFGFSGHGFQLGPASGAVLCELALDGQTSTDISAFKPGRFTRMQATHGAPA
jgi:sarcosine oxidase subunit beta